MKTFITALALTIAAASPAFAQSFVGTWGTGNIAPNVTAQNPDGVFRYPTTNQGSVTERAARERGGLSAYAYQPATGGAMSRDANQPSCGGDLGYGRVDYSAC